MRNFSNTAVETSIPLELDDVATSFVVGDTTGWAPAPLTVLLNPDGSAEEIVLVTGYTNQTITSCVRGWGGTTAVRHPAGAKVRHGAVAEDFREAAMAFRHLFGDPVYDPNKPGTPPTNSPVVPVSDMVTKSADTWADLLPANYVSPIPQGGTP